MKNVKIKKQNKGIYFSWKSALPQFLFMHFDP